MKSKHMDWTQGLKCPIRFDLDHDLDLGFSRSYMDFAIFQPKLVQLHKSKIKHIDWILGLKCDQWDRPWPWPWFYCLDLDLEFSRSYIEIYLYLSPKWSNCLETIKEQTYQFNLRPQRWPLGLILAMTLTLNFQGQIWTLPLYLGQKWSDCHKKSKHIDWTLGLKCDLGHGLGFARSNKELAGVRIYRIVTRVTSDVGMPSTRVVIKMYLRVIYLKW